MFISRSVQLQGITVICTYHQKKNFCTIVQFIRKDHVSNSSLIWPSICRTRLKFDLFYDVFSTGFFVLKMSFGPLPLLWPYPDRGSIGIGWYVCEILSNDTVVFEESRGPLPPTTVGLYTCIHRQRHSWTELKLNISESSCVIQSTNSGPLLFLSVSNTKLETPCHEQTLVIRMPNLRQHNKIMLEIEIKSYQGLHLRNPRKEKTYCLTYLSKHDEWIAEYLYWSSKIKPSDYTVISLPGKIYSFHIKITNKSELIQELFYRKKSVYGDIGNKLDSKLLDLIWLDESPKLRVKVDSRITLCNNISQKLTSVCILWDTTSQCTVWSSKTFGLHCLNFSRMTNLQREYYIFSFYSAEWFGYFNHNIHIHILKSYDEIIQILRLSSEISPIDMIFIGLWFDAKKVCMLCPIFQPAWS